MFYVTSEIYLNNDLGSLAVSVDNYPQKRKNHLTITYMIYLYFLVSVSGCPGLQSFGGFQHKPPKSKQVTRTSWKMVYE